MNLKVSLTKKTLKEATEKSVILIFPNLKKKLNFTSIPKAAYNTTKFIEERII